MQTNNHKISDFDQILDTKFGLRNGHRHKKLHTTFIPDRDFLTPDVKHMSLSRK